MLNPRQERILAAIVQEYVETAQPVSSKILVEKYGIDVSPATVRNDMAVLEETGLLRQPHTSAGRIPTEEGYRYYLDRFVRKKEAPRVRVRLTIKQIAPQTDQFKDFLRAMTKSMVKLSGDAAFVTQEDGWHYYTGVSTLFSKPEFGDVESMRALSATIDQFDEAIKTFRSRMDNQIHVWIGSENPFGDAMATVMMRYTSPKNVPGVIGFLGPQRMNYAKNIKLLSDAREMLESRMI